MTRLSKERLDEIRKEIAGGSAASVKLLFAELDRLYATYEPHGIVVLQRLLVSGSSSAQAVAITATSARLLP